MAISVFPKASPLAVLNAMNDVTHFGPGGRGEFTVSSEIMKEIERNSYLQDLDKIAHEHMGTQGDGNHFAYVGSLKSTGETALVTHHGSRGFGAKLYKKGMATAEQIRRKISPDTLKCNAWIPFDTQEGEDYWSALQVVRSWTKENHFTLHDAVQKLMGLQVSDRFWNEHNFVFQKSDGLFYHAKGATPAWEGWASDASGLTLIPLNMAEPILIVRGRNADNGLGFSPHGAGRNYSRTAHKKMHEARSDADIFSEETKGIDARFFMGQTDISELPSAYKNAGTVRRQLLEFGLAEIVDEVVPYGCIMAGDWQKNASWRRK